MSVLINPGGGTDNAQQELPLSGDPNPNPLPNPFSERAKKANINKKYSPPPQKTQKECGGFGVELQMAHLRSSLPALRIPGWVLLHPIQPGPKIPCGGGDGPAPWKNNVKITP